MGRRKGQFAQRWESQTAIGERFGLSGIAVGKVLIAEGLKDAKTKEAAQKALDEGYARATPLRDGTPFFLWRRWKVTQLLERKHSRLSQVDGWVYVVKRRIANAKRLERQAGCKAADIYLSWVVGDIPAAIRQRVMELVEGNAGSVTVEQATASQRMEPARPGEYWSFGRVLASMV